MIPQMVDAIRQRLGWCPDAQEFRAGGGGTVVPKVMAHSPEPAGDAGKPGRIRRGTGLALGSIKLLVRNRRLLWFSLLTGLVMIFSIASGMYLLFISGVPLFPGTGFLTGTQAVLIARGSLPWFVLTFLLGTISSFLVYYLLAGLIVCVSGIFEGRTVTIREGLSLAADHLRDLAGWAAVAALVGTALSYYTDVLQVTFPVLIATMAASIAFFVITVFVVPAIVLGKADLLSAIRESAAVFRKTWAELIVCFCIFFLIAFLIYLVSIVPIAAIGFSLGSAMMIQAVVILYILVMLAILFIGSTVVGIATLGLYTYAKTGTLDPAFDRGAGGGTPA